MTGYDPDKIEATVSKQWQENNTRQKVLDRNEGNERFYFLDGPPYASGNIHMGTGLNKILKDFYLRFHRKLGFNVHSQPGYDTHGLPIENKVEEEKGFNSKKEIEDFGVENFIKECQNFVDGHIDQMNDDFEDIGIWMDWENPYVTYHDYYIEGAWQTFKEAYQKGYLYEDQYPVHICTRCETAVAYNEIEYTKLDDPEVYVAMPVKDSDEEFLIWTTTPWTLPANAAIMVHPGHEYSLVKFNDRKIWMASELRDQIMEKFGIEEDEFEVLKEIEGSELEGREYNHPLEDIVPAQEDVQGRVILSERYVDLEGGTGLVHSAPGHGKEDYEVGQENDVKQISPVDLKGEFTEEAGKYEGTHVKDADPQIMEDLGENLLYSGEINHEYPKCWRCDTPLLQLSIPQWFFGATQFRDELVDYNEEVNWVPDWAGQKFHEWLEQLGDWPVSRQRYWGIPLPIWECQDCDHTKVIGDRDELPEVPDDLHRPYIDDVELDCEECGGTMERIPDVLDVWFDSGVAPWASLKNPEIDFSFEDVDTVDLELEGFDQIRGWWNSQFITSHMTYDQKPFDNVIYHGKVMLDGKEMSKSKGIVVSPEEAVEKYGRDILRFFILSGNPADDLNFTWDKMEENMEFLNILWNTYNYKDTYTGETERPENLEIEDRWILSRFNSVLEEVREQCTEPNYQAYKAAQTLEDFTKNDLSRGYIKMIRDRLKDGENQEAASWTLRKVTDDLLRLLSPFTPYLAEYLHEGEDSIHMQDLPEVNDELLDRDLERGMGIFQDVEEAAARLRQDQGIKLRHPVKRVTVSGSEEVEQAVQDLEELLKENLNAKEVVFEKVELDYEVKLDYAEAGPVLGGKVSDAEEELADLDHAEVAEKVEASESVELAGEELGSEMFDVRTHVPEGMEGEEFSDGTVYIDQERTEELLDEAFVAEVIRDIQQKRKEAELEVEDQVELSFSGDTEPLEQHEEEIRSRVNLSELGFGGEDLDYSGSVEFEGRKIEFSFSDPVE
ncbi:isoleucine--tRNA ligase [Candidatus Nanohalobium constans]|uniref:Isoleucine--tRNA ligase n=1 Tax=Candidatus Nanohalobium constans TaxID=2565781 RepID=A0A5Q0UFF8_9ARCH|nr:isoleucine--tRNA ligase [Candidatus Nanohalobium constans]QGA80306.1 isoleucyl-tRNA synthetase [Candidatus Nanohalobium constans]